MASFDTSSHADRSESPDGKAARIVTKCVYDVATGVLKRGQRLPSLREAEAVFGAHQLTVLRAYQELVRMRLVRSVPRKGYFVAETESVRRVSSHRPELEQLFDRVDELIREHTELSPLGVLRYLSRLGEHQAAEKPECVFVECTLYQAEGHAREITERFGLPCAAVSTGWLEGRPSRLPESARTVITTNFHHAEVTPVAREARRNMVDVLIEPCPSLANDLSPFSSLALVILDPDHIEQTVRDVHSIMGHPLPIDAVGIEMSQLEDTLDDLLARPDPPDGERGILLSTSHWASLSSEQQDHVRLVPLKYRIRAPEWSRLGEALGLPVWLPE